MTLFDKRLPTAFFTGWGQPWAAFSLCVAVAVSPAASAQELKVGRGQQLYQQHCASCHGADLGGQPDWREQKPDGTYPAPPHSAKGHTWHHSDAVLHDYVARGGQAVLDSQGVSFRSGMPAFNDVLTPQDINSILAFIKSTWPPRIQAAQEKVP